jgi:hypothetical protein
MSRQLRGLLAGPVRRLMRAVSCRWVSAARPAKRGGLGAWVGRAEERGAAVVEFVVVFLALLVPLVYAIVVMADVQRAMLATSSAAREVGRVYVTAADRPAAAGRVERAYAEVLGSFGLRPGQGRDRLVLDASCPAGPAGCVDGFGPGAEVRVVVTWRVAVARLPFLGVLAGPSVTVGATHRTRADRFRGFRT